MADFTFTKSSHDYDPWTETFDASGMSRQAYHGSVFWYGQQTDGNSFYLTQYGSNIVSMAINDGVNDLVTGVFSLPAAPLEHMLNNSHFTSQDWVAYLLSGDDRLSGSSAADVLSSGSGDDLVYGGNGKDILAGGSGNDLLDGGAGIDTATFAGALTGVNVDLAAGRAEGEGHDQLVSIERVIGSSHDDRLAGGNDSDTLEGESGDDLLSGGLGDDYLSGGRGTDTVTYSASHSAVSASLATGIAVGEGTDHLISIENLYGSGFDDVLTGNGLANDLIGSGGNDRLEGGAGNDVLAGGLGDDVLSGGVGRDTASYATAMYGIVADLVAGTAEGEGHDTLDGIENLQGSNQADQLTGDMAANLLEGGAGDDLLSGGAGNDTLAGGYGNDVLDGGEGQDSVSYAASAASVSIDLETGMATGEGSDQLISIENLVGSQFADQLTGDAAGNLLDGGQGDDRLAGMAGRDILTGGWGADVFVFSSLLDSRVNGADRISDFSHADGDLIDLSLIDADTSLAGDQAFQLTGSIFSGHAGELVQTSAGGVTILMGDVDGDASADFAIRLTNAALLTGADLIL